MSKARKIYLIAGSVAIVLCGVAGCWGDTYHGIDYEVLAAFCSAAGMPIGFAIVAGAFLLFPTKEKK